MGLFEWLSTPGGIELTHAVVVVLIAVSGYITYRTREHVKRVEDKADSLRRRIDGFDLVGADREQ